eukprot:12034621-Heterocapsa_arctica.AAC.1
MSLLYGDWHPDNDAKPSRWDRVRLVTALSSAQLAAPLRRDLEAWAGTTLVQDALQDAVTRHDVDTLWYLINEALTLAGR